MSAKIGTAAAKLYIGTTLINRVYQGSTLIFGSEPAAEVIALQHVTSSSSDTNIIAIPAAAQAGDLALIVDFGANPAPSDTVPSGWTKDQTVSSSLGVGHRVTAYHKHLEAGDLGTNITGFDSGSEGKVIFIMRDAGNVASAAGLQSVTDTSGDPAAITVTPAASSHPLLMVGIKYTYGGTSAFSSGAFDVAQSAGNATVGSLIVGLKYQESSSAAFTFDSADNGNAQIQAGHYLTLTL